MKIFPIVTLWLFQLFANVLSAQAMNDYNWILGYPPNDPENYFGGTRLNFDPNLLPPVYFPTLCVSDDITGISSASGRLLAYSEGCRIYNSENQVMENGDSLAYGDTWKNYCDYVGYPGSQNNLFLPWPGDTAKAILIYFKEIDNSNRQFVMSSMVEFSPNNPNGIVTEKDKILFETDITALMTATRHANGRDWWVIIPERNSNRYFILLLTPTGISTTSQSIGKAWTMRIDAGQAVFSPDGFKYIRCNPANGLNIFKFDRCMGKFSDPIETDLLSNQDRTGNGVAVSKDSRFLYVGNDTQLFQFDLKSNDILDSKILIDIYDGYLNPFWTTFYHLALAPDGKIYEFSTNGVKSLHVINHPEVKGKGCDFIQHQLQLPTYAGIGGINMPYYRLGPLDDSFCDTLDIDNLPIALFGYEADTTDATWIRFRNLSYFEPKNFYWDFGDNTSSLDEDPDKHQYHEYKDYEVCLTVSNPYGENTYCRTITIDPLTSVKSTPHEYGITLFPNPVHDILTIRNDRHMGFLFSLYSSLGSKILDRYVTDDVEEIDITPYPTGVFYYTVNWDDKNVAKGKFVKI